MSQDINSRVVTVISKFIEDQKQFTILDITEAVKADGGDYVRHQEVRPIAKPILDVLLINVYGDYETSKIIVETNNGPVEAILYAPFGTNPEDYKDRKKVASKPTHVATQTGLTSIVTAKGTIPPAALVGSAQSPSVPACVANARWSIVKKLRSDGAVEIPVEAFEEAFGCTTDAIDDVGVNIHPNSVSVEAGGTRYVGGGFRISANDLRKANLGKSGSVTVCSFRDKVVLC